LVHLSGLVLLGLVLLGRFFVLLSIVWYEYSLA
jgi:hypothetical protein